VSLDSAEKQADFAASQQVPFPMLGDPNREIGRAYGVLRLGGWLLAKRATFVIGKNGIIRRVIHSEFDIDHHVDAAAETLTELQD
jgi:peroxiredoxin Q/BCP